MGIKQELGKKIKRIRLEKGYTQDKLSEMIDISQKALSSIELGENFVTAETLDKLLNALEITSEELFATNKFKDAKDLLQKINENIALIGDDSDIFYPPYQIRYFIRFRQIQICSGIQDGRLIMNSTCYDYLSVNEVQICL